MREDAGFRHRVENADIDQDHSVKGRPPKIAEQVQSESQGGTNSS